MNVFLHEDLSKNRVVLTPEESHHCIRVLRHKEGDSIALIDGKGTYAEGSISVANKARVTVLLHTVKAQQKHDYYLHVAITPTKSMERFEWFLEKAVELGVDEITPLVSQHSERKKLNEERCRKIIVTAAKQSLAAFIPRLNPLTTLKKFTQLNFSNYDARLVAYVPENNVAFAEQVSNSKKILVAIGPEGGFSDSEIKQLPLAAVSLGKSRLRTETAGVYVCAALRTINSN